MERGNELFLALERIEDIGLSFAQAVRDEQGQYLLEQGSGGPETSRATIVRNIAFANDALARLALGGTDLPPGNAPSPTT